jgi:hypothetical protein
MLRPVLRRASHGARALGLRALGVLAFALALRMLAPEVARGGSATVAQDVASVFFIAKSENKNQVHYGVHLDEACAPVGIAPLFAYWRMLEKGPGAVEPLLFQEEAAYGFASQQLLGRDRDGRGRILASLRALPSRPIVVAVARAAAGPGDRCLATATTTIAGQTATLSSVYAQIAWPFGVEALVLTGRALSDGRELRERIRP